MRKLCVAVMMIAAVLAIVLLLAPASFSSAEKVKAFYQPVQDITVEFPNGTEIERGEEFIVIVHSKIYDMSKSGLMFYKCDKDGRPITTTSVTPSSTKYAEGNRVTHIFVGLDTNIRVNFSDLVKLDDPITDDPEDPNNDPGKDPAGITLGLDGTTIIIALTAAVAAVMLVLSVAAMRSIDAIVKEWETSS